MFKTNDNNNKLNYQQKFLTNLLKKPENKLCADCKSPNPNWASLNLGIFICIKCCGCHRQLGTHISKIKSIDLDIWPEEYLEYFQYINNKIANDYWEFNIQNFDFSKLRNNDNLLYNFIKLKYEKKNFIKNNKEYDPMTRIIVMKKKGQNLNDIFINNKKKNGRNLKICNFDINDTKSEFVGMNRNNYNKIQSLEKETLKKNIYGDEEIISYSSIQEFLGNNNNNNNVNNDIITMNDIKQTAQQIVNNQQNNLMYEGNTQLNSVNIINNNNQFQNSYNLNNLNSNPNGQINHHYNNKDFNNLQYYNNNQNYNSTNNYSNDSNYINNRSFQNFYSNNNNNQQIYNICLNNNQMYPNFNNQYPQNFQQYYKNINDLKENFQNLNHSNGNLFNFNKNNIKMNITNDPFQQFL